MRGQVKPDFHLPTEIYIQQDIIRNLAEICKKYGSRAIVVSTAADFDILFDTIGTVSRDLKSEDIGCIVYDEIPAIPTTEDIDVAVSFIQKTNCDLIIGLGGPESINSAKAISLLTTNYQFCHDLFGHPVLNVPPVPLITVPAYPLFGLEITPMLYLTEIQELSRRIFFDKLLYPCATVVDPALSLRIDDETVMKTTIGSLALSTESVISKENNDIINTYALKAIDLIFRNLPVVYSERGNVAPRTALSVASVMCGIAFSVAYLSMTLALSLALSSKTDIRVEDALCIILPHIMDFNLTSSPGKYVQMAKVMGENVRDITVIEAAIKSVEAIRKIETDVNIPIRLSAYNISKTKFKSIAELAFSYPFLGNTPRELNENELETILIAAY